MLWYRAAFTICFTAAQRVVEFVKIFNREGEVNLYIMEASVVVVARDAGLWDGPGTACLPA